MALSVIIVLYATIGLLAAAGSVFISQKIFSPKAEQIFFALFLIPIAGFYLAFTAYFRDDAAWRFEIGGLIAFSVLGLLGMRVSAMLIIGYLLHGLWDAVHEIHAHGGSELFSALRTSEIPLAYGVFCATYDWCMAAYFYTRRARWSVAWAQGGAK